MKFSLSLFLGLIITLSSTHLAFADTFTENIVDPSDFDQLQVVVHQNSSSTYTPTNTAYTPYQAPQKVASANPRYNSYSSLYNKKTYTSSQSSWKYMTGVLSQTGKNIARGGYFTYTLKRDNGQLITIKTAKNLINFLGKTVTVEYKGKNYSMIFGNMYYGNKIVHTPRKPSLPKTGAEILLVLAFATAGTILYKQRRKSF